MTFFHTNADHDDIISAARKAPTLQELIDIIAYLDAKVEKLTEENDKLGSELACLKTSLD